MRCCCGGGVGVGVCCGDGIGVRVCCGGRGKLWGWCVLRGWCAGRAVL